MKKNYNLQVSQKRYSIMKRGFNRQFDIYLFHCFKNNLKISKEGFSNYILTDNIIAEYIKCYQLNSHNCIIPFMNNITVQELNDQYKQWENENKLLKKEMWVIFQKNFISLNHFKNTIFRDEDRQCEYCEIKESEIKKLIESNLIKTKRLGTRGRIMEIDQIEPNQGYTSENMVLCCYWCNNSKTDEYSYLEFKDISSEIRRVWKKRLKI